ncbi:MAG: hypothetical protein M3454_16410 [Actinomycetota bacterium]|nr:hypothetical protein [Actinomycetota bacterium]
MSAPRTARNNAVIHVARPDLTFLNSSRSTTGPAIVTAATIPARRCRHLPVPARVAGPGKSSFTDAL